MNRHAICPNADRGRFVARGVRGRRFRSRHDDHFRAGPRSGARVCYHFAICTDNGRYHPAIVSSYHGTTSHYGSPASSDDGSTRAG